MNLPAGAAINPADANAWCYLGIACHDQDRLDEAVAAYRRAIQLQPNFPIAFNNLGNTLRLQRKLADAVACFDQALRLKPDYVNAHKNKGTALVWEGRLDEALTCYGRALEFASDDADTHKNRGVILLLLGRFDEGWTEYAWRWQTDEVSRPKYPQPLWDGSPLDGKTILLTAEQGLGDAVHFIRYAAVLKQKYGCRVIAACPKPLLRLLQTCPGIDTLVAQDEAPPAFDVYASLLDVPGILRDHPDTFPRQIPYLSADPELVSHWHDYFQAYGGYRIGLAWQGNPKHQADRMRSMPLAEFRAAGKTERHPTLQPAKGRRRGAVGRPGRGAGDRAVGRSLGRIDGRVHGHSCRAVQFGSADHDGYGHCARRRCAGRACVAGAVLRPRLALAVGTSRLALVSHPSPFPSKGGR